MKTKKLHFDVNKVISLNCKMIKMDYQFTNFSKESLVINKNIFHKTKSINNSLRDKNNLKSINRLLFRINKMKIDKLKKI